MNKKLCTILHLVYHCIFGSGMYIGANHYIYEIKKVRNEITKQSDRVVSTVSKAEVQLMKAETACRRLTKLRL